MTRAALRWIADALLFVGWACSRILTFRVRPVLDRLHWISLMTPLFFLIGGVMCGLRFGHDGWTFLRYAASFAMWTSLVCVVGDRCRRFILAYCLLSAAFDLMGMLLIGDAPDGSPIRVSLSAYELLATVVLIVGAARLPKAHPPSQASA